MATTRIQPQRVALGEFEFPPGSGKRVMVYITREWYRQLEQLANDVDGGGGSDDEEDELAGPAPLSDAGNLDAGADPDPGLSLLLDGLAEGLQAHEGETLVQQLQAQVSDLQTRIEALELEPHISLAGLESRIEALEQETP